DTPPHFKRSYVCFDALKRGWKTGCRPLIGLDGCFIKCPFKSEFLTVVGRDANNQMFPIAWVVFGVRRWYEYTIISDQQKGHDIAIFDILSMVEHRNCARYMFAIWSRRKLRKSYEFDFLQIVKCTTERGWEELCITVEKKDKDAYDNLMRNSPKMWTRAFLGTTCKSDIIDNNQCESFNSNIIEARFKSIIRMLEDIRTKMMTRIKDCVEWQLIRNGENGCELRKGRYQYTVDLSQSICSCRSWQISGILYAHACAAMYHLGLQLDDYLHELLPPIERKMPGRPKKNRRIAEDEPKKLKPDHLSRKGLLMTCTQCGQHGHNKGFCTKGNKHAKQQNAQPPKQKGKSSIKRSTTSDKSKRSNPRKAKYM
ncbi:hypothetical protein Gotur_014323, partial [Gossypium turneri]